MARLNGIGERRVVMRHALRNALAPTVQVIALTLQWLIGGIFVVETALRVPGHRAGARAGGDRPRHPGRAVRRDADRDASTS